MGIAREDLHNIDLSDIETGELLPLVHPGEILLKEFLAPLGTSQNQCARDIKVPARRINEIVLGKRTLTADTAIRLAKYFGTSTKFWMGLQDNYDLELAGSSLQDVISEIPQIRQAC